MVTPDSVAGKRERLTPPGAAPPPTRSAWLDDDPDDDEPLEPTPVYDPGDDDEFLEVIVLPDRIVRTLRVVERF